MRVVVCMVLVVLTDLVKGTQDVAGDGRLDQENGTEELMLKGASVGPATDFNTLIPPHMRVM